MNLLPKYYAEKILLHSVQTVDELADLCRKLESHYQTSRDVGQFNRDETWMHGRRKSGMKYSTNEVFVEVEKPLGRCGRFMVS
jgi:hypothetical protein